MSLSNIFSETVAMGRSHDGQWGPHPWGSHAAIGKHRRGASAQPVKVQHVDMVPDWTGSFRAILDKFIVVHPSTLIEEWDEIRKICWGTALYEVV